MPPAKKKTGSKKEAHSPEVKRLLKLLPPLKEAERSLRVRRSQYTMSGYQISRSTEAEGTSVTEMMKDLEEQEQKVAACLDRLRYQEIAQIAPKIAMLLDAGSAGFFQGHRAHTGKVVSTAARRALCRKKGDEPPGLVSAAKEEEEPATKDDDDADDPEADGDEAEDDESEDGGKSTRVPPTPVERKEPPKDVPKEGKDGKPKPAAGWDDKHTLSKLVYAYATEGLLCCCSQLWTPARDNDPVALGELLKLDPWTVDEPGQEGQGFTNALQVAITGGHIECVKLLLDKGAIFRDADWQTPPRPFVCTSMLTGAGYFDPPPPPPQAVHHTAPDGTRLVTPQPAAGCAGSGVNAGTTAPTPPPPAPRDTSESAGPSSGRVSTTSSSGLPPPVAMPLTSDNPSTTSSKPPVEMPSLTSMPVGGEGGDGSGGADGGSGGGGGPKKTAGGILYFQASHMPKRRVNRQTYIQIMEMLLDRADFSEGQDDRDMVTNTLNAMMAVEPPPAASDVAV